MNPLTELIQWMMEQRSIERTTLAAVIYLLWNYDIEISITDKDNPHE